MKKVLVSAKLILPALFPSWRFFDAIGPSPRVEFAVQGGSKGEAPDTLRWEEFRPRPERLSGLDLVRRLFWNPRWNESLFMVTCAERVIQNPSEHSSLEISSRIRSELKRTGRSGDRASVFQFRLVFMSRLDGEIRRDIIFESPAYDLCEIPGLESAVS